MDNTAVKETVEVAKEVIPEMTEGNRIPDGVVVGVTLVVSGLVVYGGYKLVKWVGGKIKDKKNTVEPVTSELEQKTEEPAAEPEKMN